MTYAIERAIDEIEQRGIRKGKRDGRRKGKLEGERKGKLEGEREGLMKAAMAMLEEGLPLETAAKCSGIPEEELRKNMENRKAQ